MITSKSRGGFTLIEVLVVIGLISVLSAILYVSFGEARQEAKNKALRSEVKEVQLALELYKAQEGEYPAATDLSVVGCADTVAGVDISNTDNTATNGCPLASNIPIISGLAPDYIAELPKVKDSANSDCDFYYYVDAVDHLSYKFVAYNCYGGASTQPEGVQADDELARCPSSCDTPSTDDCGGVDYDVTDPDFYNSYAIYSSGGECY